MLANMVRLVKDESAASAVEYGLLVGSIEENGASDGARTRDLRRDRPAL